MEQSTLQLNPVFSHAARGNSTAAAKRSFFSATTAAETTGFCFADYEVKVAPLCWRILIQVCAMAMDDYNKATSPEDKETCKQKVLDVLVRINAKALMTSAELLSFDMQPPTAEWVARNATGNWCAELTKELTQLFMSAYPADTSRIELSHNTNPVGAVSGGACDMSIIITGDTALG
jgi:hypothetical protein